MLDELERPGWIAVWDVAKGAVAMQLNYNGSNAWKLIRVFGLAGLAAGAAVSLAIPDRYVSQSAVALSGGEGPALPGTIQNWLTRERLTGLIEKHRLYEKEQTGEGMEAAVHRMRKDVKVSSLSKMRNGGDAFRIGFIHTDADLAQRVTNDLTNTILEEHARTGGLAKLALLDGASRPENPLYPNRPVAAFTGLLAGAFLGCLWALLGKLRHRAD